MAVRIESDQPTGGSLSDVEVTPSKSWFSKAITWTWEKLSDLFFNVITLGRWSKYKKSEGARESFLLAWFLSDKVTWAQAFVVFKWGWVKTTVFPMITHWWHESVMIAKALKASLEVLF